MARLFGTDGVRGVANQDVTAELAMGLSVAAANVLAEAGAFGKQRATAIVGRDTRASGEFLEAAVSAGLASAGVDVVRVGVIPTPGLAYLVNDEGTDLGVMLSASHNPMPDNGIKLFQRGGVKLDDEIEEAIEVHLDEDWPRPIGSQVGRIVDRPRMVDNYLRHLNTSLDGQSLAGLKVVVDCANGAAFHTAPRALQQGGATVISIHDRPNGLNINDGCGSTHMGSLREAVLSHQAALGLALDGDADRCLAVDANGDLVDGDQIMAIAAIDMKEQNKLVADTLVATVMSNLGLFNAMADHGIKVDQTKVGDRYVRESMVANGFSLGGEQSGHIIISEYATTGDGVLTGLQLARLMAQTGSSLHDLASVMTRLPQVLINVPGVDKLRAGYDLDVMSKVAAANHELAGSGRVLLRPSGTEPLVRVMVEAPSHEQAHRIAEELAAVVRERLSL